jgi:hypothetical protein
MAYPLKGSWTTRWYRSKASTLVTAGDCVDTDGTDIVSATTTSGGFLGIALQTKTAATAGNARIPVRVPRGRGCTFVMDVVTGTAALEGRAYDYADAATVGTGTTYKPLRVEKCLDATHLEVSAKDPIA